MTDMKNGSIAAKYKINTKFARYQVLKNSNKIKKGNKQFQSKLKNFSKFQTKKINEYLFNEEECKNIKQNLFKILNYY